jgi:putative membrane protein
MYWSNHYWGMHMFWWIFWLVVVSTLLFWAWPAPAKRRGSAIEELRRTYAAGAISEEEYRHRLAVLTEGRRDDHAQPAA